VLALLALVMGVAWTVALTRSPKGHDAAVCNPPPEKPGAAPAQLGEPVSRSAMSDIPPAKLGATKVRVLNASGRGGQATDIAGAMKDLGFNQPTAANDPIYAATRLTCQGQIRFGTAGQATAAAVWLVAPCTELFNDNRADDSVDLVLGSDFSGLAHSEDLDSVLASLKTDGNESPEPALLQKVHASNC